MTTLAFLGLGAMGRRMAARLLQAGHAVRVHNRTASAMADLAARGAVPCASAREAAEGAEVVFCMVRDDEASRAMWTHPEHGALAAARPGQILVECSTVSPGWARELGLKAAPAQARVLDAPVLGSLAPAESGQLLFVAGGEADALAAVEPLLRVMGSAVHHLGPQGSGALFKLAVNAFLGIQTAALGELLGFMLRAGLDRETVVRLFPDLPVMSPAGKGFFALMAADDHAPRFALDLMRKDLRYAGEAVPGLALPMTEAARKSFDRASAEGLGASNLTAVATLSVPSKT